MAARMIVRASGRRGDSETPRRRSSDAGPNERLFKGVGWGARLLVNGAELSLFLGRYSL
jgi:hypothetical protein